jgi:hypothetical protein
MNEPNMVLENTWNWHDLGGSSNPNRNMLNRIRRKHAPLVCWTKQRALIERMGIGYRYLAPNSQNNRYIDVLQLAQEE